MFIHQESTLFVCGYSCYNIQAEIFISMSFRFAFDKEFTSQQQTVKYCKPQQRRIALTLISIEIIYLTELETERFTDIFQWDSGTVLLWSSPRIRAFLNI